MKKIFYVLMAMFLMVSMVVSAGCAPVDILANAPIYAIAAFVVLFVIALLVTFYITYVKTKNALLIAETGQMLAAAAPAEIAAAEKALAAIEKAGEQKMNMCVNALLTFVPKQVESFFGEDVIRGIVQKAFDATDAYAKTAAESAAKKLAGKKKKTASK